MMTEQQCLDVLHEHLAKIDDVIANGYYKDNWDSLKNHPVPDWYQKAKFGIFIHWGLYSVAAHINEWYLHNMYRDERFIKHQLENYGTLEEFGYKDFVPLFKAEKFNADEWADLFKESGAKFVMPVAEHHDGFQMYDSELSDWCATKMGPKKDIVGELKEAVEKRDMILTTSSHRVEHYWFTGSGRREGTDFPDYIPFGHMYWPAADFKYSVFNNIYVPVDELFMQDWLARTCEIVDKYRPKIMYFDWWIEVAPMKPYLKKFAAYYYNRAREWGEEVTINFKNDAFMHTVGVQDIERGQLSDISPRFWQNDTCTIKNCWCYTDNNTYKTPASILKDLVDVVSKNGSLLLNVGPKGDGSMVDEDKTILREIGEWLKVNGEAIYETTHWRKYGEGPTITQEGHGSDKFEKNFTSEDFRFTFKDGALYVFAMNWPEDGVVRIKTLGKKSKLFNAVIKDVSVLGADNCKFKLCDDYLTVTADGINTDKPVCIKVVTD